MKYTIEGFDQEQLVNWNLDSNDAIILRWYVDFYHSNKMAKVEHEGEMYLWVNYQACIDDLPIMRIKNKQVIARHFKKFINCGLMKPHLAFNGGTYTCFKLIESEYMKLIEKQEQSQGVDLKVDPPQLKSQPRVDPKVDPKDNSINKDSSTKYNSNGKFKKPTIEQIESYCKERKNSIDANHFFDYYETRGWVLTNRQKMKDWKAAVRTWERNNFNKQQEVPDDFYEYVN